MSEHGTTAGSPTTATTTGDSRRARRILRRVPLVLVVSTLALSLLAACGGGTPEPSGPATTPATDPASTPPPSPGTDAPSPSGDGTGGGATDGPTVTVEHAQGTTEVPVDPATVFVFDLGVIDSLQVLGVQPDGVPEAPYPETLQEAADAAPVRIGTLTEPDLEVIKAEDPDLVVISAATAEYYPQLSRIAPTIDLTVDPAEPMESFTAHVSTLGEVFGREAEARRALDGVETKIGKARTTLKAAGATTGLVVTTSGGEFTAFGPGSRFGWLHDVLGVPSASALKARGQDGAPASAEVIAQADPDHLFVIDADAALGRAGLRADDALDDELIQGTAAARNGRIIHLDPERWYLVGFGLDNLHRMVNEVVLHVATDSPTSGGRDVAPST